MSSIFNSDAWKKAVSTYKSNKNGTPTVPTSVVGAAAGMMAGTQPRQQGVTGMPTVALKAASNVKSGLTSPSVPTAATTAAQRMVSTTTQPRTEQTLGNLSSLVNTKFSYDPSSDPAYQAAVKAAQQNLEVNQKNTNAQLRATGQGKSSYSETVANQLANQTTENIANNILPQYATQAYNQYQDSIANQGSLYNLQNQQDFQNPLSEAQVTGNYMPAEAKAAYDQILANKQSAESPTITREARAAISSETDKLRDTLKRLGIDISGLGADKTAAQASTVNPGIRTLAGQQTDETIKQNSIQNKQFDRQQNFNEGITMAGLTGQINGKATTAEQQRQLSNLWTVAEQTGTIPDELADLYGIARGTQTQSAKEFAAQLAITRQNANTSRQGTASGINNTAFNQAMDIWQATGRAPAGLEDYGIAAGTPLPTETEETTQTTVEDYAKSYIDSLAKYKDGALQNGTQVESAILTSPRSKYEKYLMYQRYGLKWDGSVPSAGE